MTLKKSRDKKYLLPDDGGKWRWEGDYKNTFKLC